VLWEELGDDAGSWSAHGQTFPLNADLSIVGKIVLFGNSVVSL
jgi:hypothetical protein